MKRFPSFGDALTYYVEGPRNGLVARRGEVVHVAGADIVVVRTLVDLSNVVVLTRRGRRWFPSVEMRPRLGIEAAIMMAVLLASGSAS